MGNYMKANEAMTDREMMDQWLVVEFGRNNAPRFSGNAPSDATGAVGFVYVDSLCGITFNVEAWSKTDGNSFQIISRLGDTGLMLLLRYDIFAKYGKRLLTPSEQASFDLPTYPDWLSVYYEGEETMRALRALPLLDPFRAHGYPDDIECRLSDEAGLQAKGEEWVWVKVCQQEGDGLFIGKLLNEPHLDFGVHAGEMVYVDVSERKGCLVAVCLGSVAVLEKSFKSARCIQSPRCGNLSS